MSQAQGPPCVDTVDEVIAEQQEIFLKRQPRSAELVEEASRYLAGGATSSWQIAKPQAVWMSHGAGSQVYDVDGNAYVDMHGGYGASIAGHAHPAIVAAVSDRVRRGTHFAQPTEDAIWVGRELSRRFGLPLWRFGNSGTESTMDAIHLMRAVTGRDLYLKLEGGYHGHHDSVQVSVMPAAEQVAPGLEVFCGMVRDPVWGPVYALGRGGTEVESTTPVTFVGPLSPELVRLMISRAGLGTWQSPLAVALLAMDALALGAPRIGEIDINPVVCAPDGGARAVDALIVLAADASPDEDAP